MRAVVQRVSNAKVTVGGAVRGSIGRGLLVLAGFATGDGPEDLAWVAGKLVRMRVFPDAAGAMNLALPEAGGGILVVSQFTLFASLKGGNRPSFGAAAKPEPARALYAGFLAAVGKELGRAPESGEFGADMQVELVNDGPVTFILDSRDRE